MSALDFLFLTNISEVFYVAGPFLTIFLRNAIFNEPPK